MRKVQLQPLGRFYLIECQSKTGSYLMECDDLPRGKDHTEASALSLLKSFDDAIAVYEVCEGKFTDVSSEIAETWLKEFSASFDPDSDEWPAFIRRYTSPLRLEEIEADICAETVSHRAHVRSFSVPA